MTDSTYEPIRKIAAWIPVSQSMIDGIQHQERFDNDPEYRKNYLAEQARLEDERRSALSRWKEDHPNFWRKLWPWTIHRWDEPCGECEE